jgi:hypothetical protein
MKRRIVSVALSQALAERLEEQAGGEGVTLSDVLRRAIEAYDASRPTPRSQAFPWQ